MKKMAVLLIILSCFAFQSLMSLEPTRKGDYFASLNPQEQSDIRYLITSLGESSYVTLLMRQKKLQEVGDRTAHIHPLRFFAYVYTDPALKKSIRKINGMAWTRFRDGMAGSLEKAWKREDMGQPVVEDFAKEAGVSSQFVTGFVEKRDWKALIDGVRRASS